MTKGRRLEFFSFNKKGGPLRAAFFLTT